MAKVTAVINVDVGGKVHAAGDTFEVDDENAKWLAEQGAVVLSKGVTEAAPKWSGEKGKK